MPLIRLANPLIEECFTKPADGPWPGLAGLTVATSSVVKTDEVGLLPAELIIKKDSNFPDEKFDTICFNLKILAQVNQGDKLCIIRQENDLSKTTLMIEARSGIWRWISSDNRLATAEFLIELINNIKNILPLSGEQLKFLISDLSQAQNGLRNLAATYQSDDVMVAKLQLIRRQMESILNSLY